MSQEEEGEEGENEASLSLPCGRQKKSALVTTAHIECKRGHHHEKK